MRLPDRRRSRAFLFGTAGYTDAGLADLPGVANNLTDLAEVLSDRRLGGFAREHCTVLLDPAGLQEAASRLADIADQTEDVLLVYYAGHGLVDGFGELHLAMSGSQRHRPHVTALPFQLLRRLTLESPARNRVVILDCCFAGRAVELMSDAASVVSSQVQVEGAYTLASAPPNMPAYAPGHARHTAFSGELIALLRDGVHDGPELITLHELYRHLAPRLRARGLPVPQQGVIAMADQMALTRNAAWRPAVPAPAVVPVLPPREAEGEGEGEGERPGTRARPFWRQALTWLAAAVLAAPLVIADSPDWFVLTGISTVAAGTSNSVAVAENGSIWTWGSNDYHQLGNSVPVYAAAATHGPVVRGVTGIDARSTPITAVVADGSVWQWGISPGGPARDPELARVVATSAGYGFLLALRSDGTVLARGYNADGELGNGSLTDSSTMVTVADLRGVRAISAAATSALALRSDGTVWAWGVNSNGQLGDGTTAARSTPVRVAGLDQVRAISESSGFSVALKADGTVWAWGDSLGLGTGFTTDSLVPVKISKLQDVRAIATGTGYALALRSDGTVWAWGIGSSGPLGDGRTNGSGVPVRISNLSQVRAIAAGYDHALAVRSDGTVWAWGHNDHGQLGDRTTSDHSVPVQVQVNR